MRISAGAFGDGLPLRDLLMGISGIGNDLTFGFPAGPFGSPSIWIDRVEVPLRATTAVWSRQADGNATALVWVEAGWEVALTSSAGSLNACSIVWRAGS